VNANDEDEAVNVDDKGDDDDDTRRAIELYLRNLIFEC
jgi:hypothetical protein